MQINICTVQVMMRKYLRSYGHEARGTPEYVCKYKCNTNLLLEMFIMWGRWGAIAAPPTSIGFAGSLPTFSLENNKICSFFLYIHQTSKPRLFCCCRWHRLPFLNSFWRCWKKLEYRQKFISFCLLGKRYTQ